MDKIHGDIENITFHVFYLKEEDSVIMLIPTNGKNGWMDMKSSEILVGRRSTSSNPRLSIPAKIINNKWNQTMKGDKKPFY